MDREEAEEEEEKEKREGGKKGRDAHEVLCYSITSTRLPLTWCSDTKISHSSQLLHKLLAREEKSEKRILVNVQRNLSIVEPLL